MPANDLFYLALVLGVFGMFAVVLAYGSVVASGEK